MSSQETGGGEEAFMQERQNNLVGTHGEGIKKLTFPEQEELIHLEQALQGKRDKAILLDPKLKGAKERRRELMQKMSADEESEGAK